MPIDTMICTLTDPAQHAGAVQRYGSITAAGYKTPRTTSRRSMNCPTACFQPNVRPRAASRP